MLKLVIDATLSQVRAVLLDALALPDWNPAFTSINGPATAAVQADYRLTVRPGLRGHLTYDVIEPITIRMSWHVPGFSETGSWHLVGHGIRTLVRHDFRHTGPLASALGGAYRGVAELRLRRLANRLARALVREEVRSPGDVNDVLEQQDQDGAGDPQRRSERKRKADPEDELDRQQRQGQHLGTGCVEPDHPAHDDLRDAHRQEAHQEWRAGRDADPLEGTIAIGREAHERPHVAGAGEVPDPERQGSPKPSPRTTETKPAATRMSAFLPAPPGWASSCLASVSVSHAAYFSSLQP